MDSERIKIKIRELISYREELYEVIPDNLERYLKSVEKKRATERILQIMIECVIDICFMLNKELHNGPPPTETSVFRMLENDLTHIDTLKSMKGFRNILVHKYGTVDNELVFEYATEKLDDFDTFISDVEDIIETHQEKD